MSSSDEWHWVKTVGAPEPGDPRDGELHQLYGELPDHFDLEPWDEDPNKDEASDRDARYFKKAAPPVVDDEGRLVWLYEFRADVGD